MTTTATRYQLSCGDVMPGCPATFSEADTAILITRVADHAASAHGLSTLTPELRVTVASKVHVAG